MEQYNLRTHKPNISSFTLIFSKCRGFIVAILSMMGVFYGPEIQKKTIRRVQKSLSKCGIISPRSHRNQVHPYGRREARTCVFVRGCVLGRRWRRDGAISHIEVAQNNVWTAIMLKTKSQEAKREITARRCSKTRKQLLKIVKSSD